MTFTVTKLVSGGHLVEGTDKNKNTGTTVVYSQAWAAVEHFRAHTVASEEFDKTVEKFFAPLTKAAEKFEAANPQTQDADAQITFGDHVEGKTTTTFDLDEGGIILNLIEQGKTDRLRWVGDQLVVTV